jgi:hypothetical protein
MGTSFVQPERGVPFKKIQGTPYLLRDLGRIYSMIWNIDLHIPLTLPSPSRGEG